MTADPTVSVAVACWQLTDKSSSQTTRSLESVRHGPNNPCPRPCPACRDDRKTKNPYVNALTLWPILRSIARYIDGQTYSSLALTCEAIAGVIKCNDHASRRLWRKTLQIKQIMGPQLSRHGPARARLEMKLEDRWREKRKRDDDGEIEPPPKRPRKYLPAPTAVEILDWDSRLEFAGDAESADM